MNLNASELKIDKILSEDYCFSVPAYQRPYSWKEDQARELLEDILDAKEHSAEGFYFLGSIVLIKEIKEKNEREAKIIDGQQRLVTLTILLSVIRDLLPKDKQNKAEKYIKQKAADYLVLEEDNIVLTLRPREETFFREYIQQENALERREALLKQKPKKKLTEIEENILDNSKIFYSLLREKTSDEMIKILTFIVANCSMVVIAVPSESVAFRIFDVLNTRGLDLTDADILKAHLVQKIYEEVGEEEADKQNKEWEDIEVRLNKYKSGTFINLLNHISYYYKRESQRKELAYDFKKYVTPFREYPSNFIKNILSPYANIYDDILNNLDSFKKRLDDQDFMRLELIVESLNLDRSHRVCYPLLFLLTRLDEAYFSENLKKIEILNFYLNLKGEHSWNKLDRYRAALNVEDENNFHFTGKIDLDEREIYELFDCLDREKYKKSSGKVNNLTKLLLLKIDSTYSDNMAQYYSIKKIEIEHVLPQNPGEDSQWCQDFTEEEREKWTNRLANLVPLSKSKNSSANNRDFEDKKNTYFFKDGKRTAFRLTDELKDISQWTPKILEERQKELMRRLAREWNIEAKFDEWLEKRNRIEHS